MWDESQCADLGFIVHLKWCEGSGPDQHVNPQTQGFEIWCVFPDHLRLSSRPVQFHRPGLSAGG